jgi:hypothetical protein
MADNEGAAGSNGPRDGCSRRRVTQPTPRGADQGVESPAMPSSLTSFIAALLSLWLVLQSPARAQTTAPARQPASTEPGVLEKVEQAVVRGAKAAASGVERGVKAAEHGAKVAASGVERGAKAAASGVQRGAHATGDAVQSVAKKVGGPSAAASQASK